MQQLHAFSAIGWDFDGVLMNHPAAPLFHDFIHAHPEKRHAILTFRCYGWQRTIFRELRARYRDPPTSAEFTHVISMEVDAFQSYHLRRLMRLGKRTEHPTEIYFRAWKGMMCQRHGLPVLIDDRPDRVRLGCEQYGIVFIHPDELTQR